MHCHNEGCELSLSDEIKSMVIETSPLFWDRELLDLEQHYNDCRIKSFDKTYATKYAENKNDLVLRGLRVTLAADTKAYIDGLNKAFSVYEQEMKNAVEPMKSNAKAKRKIVEAQLSKLASPSPVRCCY